MSDDSLSLAEKKINGDVWRDLNAMHHHFKFHDVPFNKRGLLQRLNFIKEELDETFHAFDNKDANELVDGLIDIIVVAVGSLDLLRADSEASWKEVMRANMRKELGFNDKRPDTQGKDLIKPEGWRKPNLYHFVGQTQSILDEDDTTSGYFVDKVPQREAINVLQECIDLMKKKSKDYNSLDSGVLPADYYPFGMMSIFQMIWTKVLRIKSVMMKLAHGKQEEFESLEDSLKDNIVYTSFAIEYFRKKMSGQNKSNDIFNRF